jgi:hypothetical protein
MIGAFSMRREREKNQGWWDIVTVTGQVIWMGESTTGLIFFLNNSVVCWQSMKRRIVAMSSCEAGYVAAAACQIIWLARLLTEMLNKEIERPVLKIDNKSAISTIKKPVLNDRSRHIDTRFHLIREHEATGQVGVEFIGTKDQLGDIFTKSLSRIRFLELTLKVGVYSVSG